MAAVSFPLNGSKPIPTALPCRPVLAQTLILGEGMGEDAIPDLKQGEVVNIINGTPDGRLIYGVARSGSSTLREGWLKTDAVRVLGTAEVENVPIETRLPFNEILEHTTLVCADEDWADLDDESTLWIRAGDIIQIGMTRRSWLYGWLLDAPARRGWFPATFAHHVTSSMEMLAKEEEEDLAENSLEHLAELFKTMQAPPRMEWHWDGELPEVVEESERELAKEWQAKAKAAEDEALAQAQHAQAHSQTQAQPESAGMPIHGESTPPVAEDGVNANARVVAAPEELYPLVVCKVDFKVPGAVNGELLELRIGDLVRVTSILETAMYHGFLENKHTQRGWFPKNCVQLVEDPLDTTLENQPIQLGPPPLPVVPASLRR